MQLLPAKKIVTALTLSLGLSLLHSVALGLVLVQSAYVWAEEVELSGKAGFEQRYFFDSGTYPQQLSHGQTSVFIEPELYWQWNNGEDSITFKPFYRQDSQDDKRSHGDIRELAYIHAADDWEIRAGIRKEFWGVTEFQHLVDVINQTDGVDDFDGEDKLGQLMLNMSLVNDWGIVDVFILPGFRERTFAGENGRLRAPILVDQTTIDYQSSAKEHHLDLALRWAHSLGDFDLGAYWFHGTNRDPYLTPHQQNEQVVLQQYYAQMEQLGVDVQATKGDWLWKFESIYRHTDIESFWATQAGFEYTFVGIFDSAIDFGYLVEHSWDSRGEATAQSQGSAFQNDLFLGGRFAFNDIQSTELLAGIGSDLDHHAVSFIVEANRRLGENFKASIDIRLFQTTYPYEAMYSIKNDDHLQAALEWYF